MLFLASNGTTILCPSINWSEGEGPQVVDRCGRLFTFDDQHKRIRENPRMTEILEAAASSTSYSEAVKAKLEGLSAEEVKQLPLGHGAREYQRWWNTMGVLDDKEDTILVMDGHRIVVPMSINVYSTTSSLPIQYRVGHSNL